MSFRIPTRAGLAWTALLTSCGGAAQIPDALLDPPPRPAVPAPGASDGRVASFILEQEAWGDKVVAQFGAIKAIVGR